MASVVGKTTSAVLLSSQEAPQACPNANSYLDSLGLNLKERSSGKRKGQMKITKRGPGMARSYLYFSALRWIKEDAEIRHWYQRKVAHDGGLKSNAVSTSLTPCSLRSGWINAKRYNDQPEYLYEPTLNALPAHIAHQYSSNLSAN